MQCQCEHESHFSDIPGKVQTEHSYLGVPAGEEIAWYVGPICDKCANGHLSDMVIRERETES